MAGGQGGGYVGERGWNPSLLSLEAVDEKRVLGVRGTNENCHGPESGAPCFPVDSVFWKEAS